MNRASYNRQAARPGEILASGSKTMRAGSLELNASSLRCSKTSTSTLSTGSHDRTCVARSGPDSDTDAHTWSSPLQPAPTGAVRILLQQDSKQLDTDGEVVSHTDRAGHREDI